MPWALKEENINLVCGGAPGVRCRGGAPLAPAEGFNAFLRKLDVTFRRDAENFRPRINKRGSVLDREQKQAGDYYNLDDGGGGGACPCVVCARVAPASASAARSAAPVC